MRSGSLRHKITIQEKRETQDATTGEITSRWIDFACVSADIQPLSVREFIAAQGVQSEVTGRIVIRYLEGVTAKMRVSYRGLYYNILGVLPDAKSGREYLTLAVSEGTNAG